MNDQTRLKELLHYNPNTGNFTWKARPANRVCVGDKAGYSLTTTGGKSYIMIGLGGNRYYAHRLAWLLAYGEFPTHEIDHINGDGVDNRLCNLRRVTHSENGKNRRLHSNNISGYVGVHWNKASRKWRAQIQVDLKTIYLGYFKDIDDAIKARKESEIKHGFHQNNGESRPL